MTHLSSINPGAFLMIPYVDDRSINVDDQSIIFWLQMIGCQKRCIIGSWQSIQGVPSINFLAGKQSHIKELSGCWRIKVTSPHSLKNKKFWHLPKSRCPMNFYSGVNYIVRSWHHFTRKKNRITLQFLCISRLFF
jgi:hypothetical protein